jgi:hypothetical protein
MVVALALSVSLRETVQLVETSQFSRPEVMSFAKTRSTVLFQALNMLICLY